VRRLEQLPTWPTVTRLGHTPYALLYALRRNGLTTTAQPGPRARRRASAPAVVAALEALAQARAGVHLRARIATLRTTPEAP
jgi:hypothetical protein